MNAGIKTIDQQASAAALLNLTWAKMSFKSVLAISKTTALKLNTHAVFSEYNYHIRNDECAFVTFTEDNARRYMYKPKLLAYALYGNIELYALILRLNHMKSVSDFTMESLMNGIIVPYTSIKDFFNEVFIKEKAPINRNIQKVEDDVKLTQI